MPLIPLPKLLEKTQKVVNVTSGKEMKDYLVSVVEATMVTKLDITLQLKVILL
jgi:hypothetical protein